MISEWVVTAHRDSWNRLFYEGRHREQDQWIQGPMRSVPGWPMPVMRDRITIDVSYPTGCNRELILDTFPSAIFNGDHYAFIDMTDYALLKLAAT